MNAESWIRIRVASICSCDTDLIIVTTLVVMPLLRYICKAVVI